MTGTITVISMYGLLATPVVAKSARTVHVGVEANPQYNNIWRFSWVFPQVRYSHAGDRETACPPR